MNTDAKNPHLTSDKTLLNWDAAYTAGVPSNLVITGPEIPCNTITFHTNGGKAVMIMTADGRLEKGEGISNDEVTQLIFDALKNGFDTRISKMEKELVAAKEESTRMRKEALYFAQKAEDFQVQQGEREIKIAKQLNDEFVAERAAFAEFRKHTWEEQEKLRAELADQKVENNHNWMFQEISEEALKRAETAETKLAGVRAAVVDACKNALHRPLVWYPEKTQAYIHPNSVLEINEFQTKACVAAVQAVFDVATLQNSESKGEK